MRHAWACALLQVGRLRDLTRLRELEASLRDNVEMLE
jgi:hypothetical protein